jgi:hypothetical protein
MVLCSTILKPHFVNWTELMKLIQMGNLVVINYFVLHVARTGQMIWNFNCAQHMFLANTTECKGTAWSWGALHWSRYTRNKTGLLPSGYCGWALGVWWGKLKFIWDKISTALSYCEYKKYKHVVGRLPVSWCQMALIWCWELKSFNTAETSNQPVSPLPHNLSP